MTSVVVMTYIALCVLLGYHAYGRPDGESATYYVLGIKDVVSSDREKMVSLASKRGITLPKGYPIDMAYIFNLFFKWGFWNMILLVLVLTGMTIAYNKLEKKSFNTVVYYGSALIASLACSALFHLFLGTVWRFSNAGNLVSGQFLDVELFDDTATNETELGKIISDGGYQLQGGRFMKRFLTAEIALLFLLSFASLGTCVWLCLFKR